MELVYIKDRMWCIYIHHRVWICYPNVVRRYGRGMSATCPLRAEMSHMWPCQEMRKHMVLPLTEKHGGRTNPVGEAEWSLIRKSNVSPNGAAAGNITRLDGPSLANLRGRG